MEVLLQTAFDLLEAYNFTVRWEPGEPTVITGHGTVTDGLALFIYCNALEQPRRLAVNAVLPFSVPAQRRAAVHQLLRRLNDELGDVRFFMDDAKGTLVCRAVVPVGLGQLAELQVDRLLARCLYMAERYESVIHCAAAIPLVDESVHHCKIQYGAWLN